MRALSSSGTPVSVSEHAVYGAVTRVDETVLERAFAAYVPPREHARERERERVRERERERDQTDESLEEE